MARAKTGAAAGYAWALVVFGAGFFICLILAIVFYTQNSGLQQVATDAETQLATVANRAQLESTELTSLPGEGTLVYKLQQRNEELNNRVAGLTSERDQAVTNATEELKRFNAQKADAEEARASLAAAQQSLSDIRTQLTADVQKMSDQIATAQTVNEELQAKIQQASTEMAEVSSQKTGTLQVSIDQQQVALIEARSRIDELIRQITIITTPEQRVEAPDVTPADANITGFGPDRQRVYLNIGRNANLRLGMAFNVFDADEIIKIEDSQISGKAIVEIIRIDATSSVARIVEQNDRTKLENGDKVANIAFDPNRIFRFFVYGQYALNKEGKIDLDDIEIVKGLVLDSGGELASVSQGGAPVDSLTFETDYLVLGIEPNLPEKPQDTRDLIAMREYRTEVENFEAYQNLKGKAKELQIPVLNQNRFLDLIGYYVR